MENTFEEHQKKIIQYFENVNSKDGIYKKIIELGALLPPLEPEHHTPEHRVHGCQSMLYLHSCMRDKKIYFQAYSDALITKGLAFLLITLYNGLTPDEVLTKKPTLLNDLGIYSSLSLNRSNGLSELYLKMQRQALLSLTQK